MLYELISSGCPMIMNDPGAHNEYWEIGRKSSSRTAELIQNFNTTFNFRIGYGLIAASITQSGPKLSDLNPST